MNKTKIDWATHTWNPVTGCLHGCPYCYARGIAQRFGTLNKGEILPEDEGLTFLPDKPERFYELDKPARRYGKAEPFPANFYPTLHRYRLDEPAKMEKPGNIFVVSMGDLFGEWVPDEWISAVFDACRAAPQHNYMFLTKNPTRYLALSEVEQLPTEQNFWYGSTATVAGVPIFFSGEHNTFVSAEPLNGPVFPDDRGTMDWVIVGAETGNRSGKGRTERGWVLDLAAACTELGIPVFMKSNLVKEGVLSADELVQEYPDELRTAYDS